MSGQHAKEIKHAISVYVRDVYILTLLTICLVSSAGVAIWGNDLRAGRFFMVAGPGLGILVLGVRQKSRADEAKESSGELHDKVDTVMVQTNGKKDEELARVARLAAEQVLKEQRKPEDPNGPGGVLRT